MALSSAAPASPCKATAPVEDTISRSRCTAADADLVITGSTSQVDSEAVASWDVPDSAIPDPTDLADRESLGYPAARITNLQATMTCNRYVAGRILPIPPTSPTEDLTMYAPDYLSVKLLPRIPQRRPVGLGLVTLPNLPGKRMDATPGGEGLDNRSPNAGSKPRDIRPR